MRRIIKQRRQLRLGIISAIFVIVCGYSIFLLNKNTPISSTQTTSPLHVPFAKDVQLAWPATGQAAVGSVQDGLLARSSKNEQQRPTASMAKVIAALAIMKKHPIDSGQSGPSYTVSAQDVANYRAYVSQDGSVLPVYQGMVLTQYQAMQAMLIASADNIADMLVERVFGSDESYITYANNMLHGMGLTQTNVADASGFDPATISTPSELVAIGIAALKDPVIAEIVAQSQAQIPGVGTIKNTNQLLGVEGIVGIKTGTTDAAGKCLLFAASYTTQNQKEVTIVGVIMGDTTGPMLFSDTTQLLHSAEHWFDQNL